MEGVVADAVTTYLGLNDPDT